jgi:hypothetical protein
MAPVAGKAGDMLYFNGFLPHRSLKNRSGKWQYRLYSTMLSVQAREPGPTPAEVAAAHMSLMPPPTYPFGVPTSEDERVVQFSALSSPPLTLLGRHLVLGDKAASVQAIVDELVQQCSSRLVGSLVAQFLQEWSIKMEELSKLVVQRKM